MIVFLPSMCDTMQGPCSCRQVTGSAICCDLELYTCISMGWAMAREQLLIGRDVPSPAALAVASFKWLDYILIMSPLKNVIEWGRWLKRFLWPGYTPEDGQLPTLLSKDVTSPNGRVPWEVHRRGLRGGESFLDYSDYDFGSLSLTELSNGHYLAIAVWTWMGAVFDRGSGSLGGEFLSIPGHS